MFKVINTVSGVADIVSTNTEVKILKYRNIIKIEEG